MFTHHTQHRQQPCRAGHQAVRDWTKELGLFANTKNGAEVSAMLYRMIETAKANGLIAYDYLVKVFEELPKRKTGADIDDLLPWNVTLAS